jgi:RNA recognition motif-containing protein
MVLSDAIGFKISLNLYLKKKNPDFDGYSATFAVNFNAMDIHVTNLPFKLREDELKELFEVYGTVESAHVVLDHKLRQSKGYGFVKMPDDEQAAKAIKALDGFAILEREIKVSKSRTKAEAEKSEKKFPFWKQKKAGTQKLVTFDDEPERKERKKRRGQGRGTTY